MDTKHLKFGVSKFLIGLLFISCSNETEFDSPPEAEKIVKAEPETQGDFSSDDAERAPSSEDTEEFDFEDIQGIVISNGVDEDVFVEDIEELAEEVDYQLEAQSASYAIDEDTTLAVRLIANAESEPNFFLKQGPNSGAVTVNLDGSFQYEPDANYFGQDSFTYVARLGDAVSEGQISIEIRPVNDSPQGLAAVSTMLEDGQMDLVLEGTDADNDKLEYSFPSLPSQGELKIGEDNSFTYVPNPDFNGTESFTYQLSDGVALSPIYDISIVIENVNDSPVIGMNKFNFIEDQQGNGQLSATDIDADSLTYTLVSGPVKGELLLNADGSFTFSPGENLNGPDSFTFQVDDSFGGTVVGTAELLINAEDDPIIVQDDQIVTQEDMAITNAVKFMNPDGYQPLEIQTDSAPTNGSLSLSNQGLTYTYTPNANFNGNDTFQISIKAGDFISNTATISVEVTPVNDPVSASDLSLETQENTPVSSTIIASDPDNDTLQFSISKNPDNGTLSAFSTATGAFTYMPSLDYSGVDTFDVAITDNNGSSVTITVSVTVKEIIDVITDLCLDSPAGSFTVSEVLASFPTRKDCSFGANGNLSAQNGYLRARETQSYSIPLPANAVLCEFEVASSTSNWHYDDFTMLTLNDRVLVSSNESLRVPLTSEAGIFLWDWNNVKGSLISNFEATSYCLGGTCTIPPHDQQGALNITLNQNSMFELAKQILATSSLELNLMSFGDNDAEDCFHSGLDLNVRYKYVLQSQ